MNQQQRKYALARVSEIKEYKLLKLKEECTEKEARLNDKERLEAFKKGEFKIRKDVSKISTYTHIVNVVTFNAEKEKVFFDKIFTAKSALIEKQASKVADEIMLGDALEAMKLLEKFEA